jgi:hypothetical protein
MWRIGESMIGSYTGKMAPPGNPKITSTPSISRDLMRAWPPLSCIRFSGKGLELVRAGVGCVAGA